MADLLSVISGDNLFKYSFTLGIAMIAFSIIYPMEKQHELELQRLDYKAQVALISLDIEILQNKIKRAQERDAEFEEAAKSFKKMSKASKNRIRQSFTKYSKELDEMQKDRQTLKVKNAAVDSKKERIVTLEKQVHQFDTLTNVLGIAGAIIAFLGLIFWTRQTFYNLPPR